MEAAATSHKYYLGSTAAVEYVLKRKKRAGRRRFPATSDRIPVPGGRTVKKGMYQSDMGMLVLVFIILAEIFVFPDLEKYISL